MLIQVIQTNQRITDREISDKLESVSNVKTLNIVLKIARQVGSMPFETKRRKKLVAIEQLLQHCEKDGDKFLHFMVTVMKK